MPDSLLRKQSINFCTIQFINLSLSLSLSACSTEIGFVCRTDWENTHVQLYSKLYSLVIQPTCCHNRFRRLVGNMCGVPSFTPLTSSYSMSVKGKGANLKVHSVIQTFSQWIENGSAAFVADRVHHSCACSIPSQASIAIPSTQIWYP